MRLTIAYSKIKKRNLVLINNATHQRETLSERPIRPPLTVYSSGVFLWENHKNLFFITQKLDHDGNKMWAPIPWDNTFQLVTAKFQETEVHFC